MARQESDREDLMREAVALVRRAELAYPGRSDQDPIVAGFRKDGRLAVYFGADPVFQFDDRQRLRRAYAAGFLYRTQGETLARLFRHRTPLETQLLRHDLAPAELTAFKQTAKNHLTELLQALVLNEVQVLAQIPAEADILGELQTALREILDRDIPLAPAIPGKR